MRFPTPVAIAGFRLLSMLATILCVSALIFALLFIVPGDPIDSMLGEQASAIDRVALRHTLGLDLPFGAQITRYYRHLIKLDFGTSLITQQPINALLRVHWWATFKLAVVALLMALCIALPLGVIAARKVGCWQDHLIAGFASFGTALPNFVLGPALIVIFAVGLGWAPIAGNETAGSIVLPALTLSIGLSAVLARQLRAALLGVLGEKFIQAAVARGLRPSSVLWRHALPNAALTMLTIIGMQFGGLLGGTVITETIFSWPGIGALTIEGITRRDYPLVQACMLCIAVTYVVVNSFTDVLYTWCDPRIKQR